MLPIAHIDSLSYIADSTQGGTAYVADGMLQLKIKIYDILG